MSRGQSAEVKYAASDAFTGYFILSEHHVCAGIAIKAE